MDRIRLRGGRPLDGSIAIGGAKNAALPLMAASLLTADTLTLGNVPHLADIATMAHLLQQHGVDVSMDGGNGTAEGRTIHLNAGRITSTVAPYDLVRKMRASVLVLGPLLARFGEAEVSLPGGCAIGTRPVDLHIMGLKALGAEITVEGGYIKATAKQGLKGAVIRFPMVSVGATENLLMAAALAEGTTVLENAAREPEITDLCHCLIAMGAEIEGLGSEHLTVHGKPSLRGARHSIVPDRIETGTYAAAAAICGGRVELTGTRIDLFEAVADKLREAGCEITETERGVTIARNGSRLRGVDFLTQPYPGFPTDMQAQVMVLMTVADGAAMITETIFENRFMHVPELARMGANIVVHGSSALVRGVPKLTGAPVMATDLRASVSLVLAGLAAEGETVVNRVYHLDRGYERLEEKLAACGAVIERLKD
jgi:UDP-N-acetylglucosamine 1-carboxyvinyltransferase